MKKSFILAVSMLLCTSAFVGCSNEEHLTPSSGFTVKAAMDVESRTALGGDHSSITWSKGDQIYLFGGNSKATLSLINGAETNYGEFSGGVNGSSFELEKALYPIPTVNGDEYSFELPSVRNYSTNSAAPMYGTYSDGLVQFKNLAALIRVSIGSSAEDRILKLQMGGIAGKLVVDVTQGKASIPTGATDEVSVNVPAGDVSYVDIPVPAKQYAGYSVLLDEKVIATTTEEFTLKENDVRVIVTEPGKDDEGAYLIRNSADLIWMAKEIKDGNSFDGITLKVVNDIDLRNVITHGDDSFTPIGDDATFEGTLDGQDHTISNLYQSGWDFNYYWGSYGSIGLFSNLKDATIKNLKIDGFEGQIEGGDIAFIAGSATGECVFENIEITNSKIGTYNNGIGSIIGWSGAGDYTFKNIKIGADVVLGGLWGSFDSSVGGIVGQAEPGASYTFENVEINCRLDVYNDCTASYDYYLYRMCGMIIGRCEETTTIDGKNYPDLSKYNITCTNVTVNYGDWMNYHYCEPTPGLNGGRGMRVEPGYAYDGLPADFDHTQCTANHMTCIPFDGLFGGDQYGVNPIKEYAGVTVNYPASFVVGVSTKEALKDAVTKGKSVRLEENIDYGTDQLAVTKPIVIDLNGKTLTTSMAYGGISLKGGASIKNGTILHTSTVAAIKAFDAASIEDIDIQTTCQTTDKVITAIAVQQYGKVDVIKNVTISGVSQGVEVPYQATVGLIENVEVNEAANGTKDGIGLVINGGKVVKAKDCTFKGDTYGVTMHLKGVFDVALELENCKVEGNTASIYAWDEKGISNTSGSLTLTYDAQTTLKGDFIWDFEDECKSVVNLNRP